MSIRKTLRALSAARDLSYLLGARPFVKSYHNLPQKPHPGVDHLHSSRHPFVVGGKRQVTGTSLSSLPEFGGGGGCWEWEGGGGGRGALGY